MSWPAHLLEADVTSAETEGTGDIQLVTVSSDEDSGPGSLRAALEKANASGQPYRIVFGDAEGPFSVPQVIELASPLPVIQSQVEIDGFIPRLLWKAYGVTVSGEDKFRIFEVAPQGELRITGITLKNGRGDRGGSVLNHGRLIVEGVTFVENEATGEGGAVANQDGEAYVINSTAYANRAARGGAVANLAGKLRLTNVTLHENKAETGSAVYSDDQLILNNSILTGEGAQCVNSGALIESRHNIFLSAEGCGKAINNTDPELGELSYYNGPTPTLPISGLSPARNLGDNEAALDPTGNPLKWDQRGNGDPRFTRGYVDIGAFEHQSHLPTEHIVDMIEDNNLRGCTAAGSPNCPLRAAVELSLAGRKLVPVRFDPDVFASPQVLKLESMPASADEPLIIDGVGTAGVIILVPEPVPWTGINGAEIELLGSPARPGD